MQILLRSYKEEEYVWKTAKYNGCTFVVDGDNIYETDVVSIINDNRKGCVVCRSCGAFFKNDAKKIEEHRHRFEKADACLRCQYLKITNRIRSSSKIVKQKNGTYVQQATDIVQVGCKYGRYFGTLDINSEEAKNNCALRRCLNAEITPFEDVFLQYPGVFDHIATVDKIIDVGYKSRSKNAVYTKYALKGRNQIVVYVNSLGIVDHIKITYHDNTFQVYYSKKYDRLFQSDGYRYTPFDSYYCIPESTMEYIKRKIAELYE